MEAFTGITPTADWKRIPRRPQKNWLQQIEEGADLPISACQLASEP